MIKNCKKCGQIIGKNEHICAIRIWNKGLKWTEEMKRKISESRKGKCLGNQNAVGHKPNKTSYKPKELSPKWKGGITLGENKKSYYRFKCLERVNKKKKLVGSHTVQEWFDLKKKYNFMCLCCKKIEPEITLSQDHIIPISLGGSDYIDNIQPLCRLCNSKKWSHVIDYKKSFIISKVL